MVFKYQLPDFVARLIITVVASAFLITFVVGASYAAILVFDIHTPKIMVHGAELKHGYAEFFVGFIMLSCGYVLYRMGTGIAWIWKETADPMYWNDSLMKERRCGDDRRGCDVDVSPDR